MSKRKSFLILLSLLATTSIGVGSLASCDNNKEEDKPVLPQINYYNVILTETGDYILKSNVEKAAEGEQVEITVEIKNKEKVLINLEADGVTFNKVEDNKYTFKMPASHVTIKALLEDKTYQIETKITGANYTLTTNKENNVAKAGELIAVTVSNLEAGYMVKNVSIKEEGSKNWVPAVKVDEFNYTFMMPSKNVQVMAVTEKVDFNITLLSTNEDKVTLKAFKDDTEVSKAQVGDFIKLEPQILDEEWEITKVTVSYDENEKELSLENGKYGFLMEAKPVTVKVYAAIKEASVSIIGENLENIEVSKIEEIKGNDVINTYTSGFESITSVVGRKLRVYAKAKHNPARVLIKGMNFNETTINKDKGTEYFETTSLLKENTISFVTDPVAQHTITVSNPNNLMLFAYINEAKKAVPETVYNGQELKLQLKNNSALDVLDLEQSGVFKADGTKLYSFTEKETTDQNKVYDTSLFAITENIEIRVVTSNKLLGRIYKANASDSMYGTEYEAYVEVLTGNKIHFLLQQLDYSGTKYVDEDIKYETLTDGNLSFTTTVNGTKSTIKFKFTDYEVDFIDAYFAGLMVNFTRNDAKLTHFNETLVSTDSEDTTSLVVNKDGNATYGDISGNYTITSDYDGWYLNIGEEKFILNLPESKFTYVVKEAPALNYFFVGQTFKASYFTPYDEYGNGGEKYELTIQFGTKEEGSVIKSLVYKERGTTYINEADLTYTIEEVGKSGYNIELTIDLKGTSVVLSVHEYGQKIRFFNGVRYNGYYCSLNYFSDITL